MTDAELVQDARAGDPRAFGALVDRYQGQAYALAYSLLGDWAEAQDMAQEAFLRAYRNLDLLADPARFGPWLRRIVFGTCVDWARRFRPELFRSTHDNPGGGPSGFGGEAATAGASGPGAGPLEQLLLRELSQVVLEAIAALPDRQRVPLTLFHLDGLSHEKVARFLGVPVGTVRSLVSRARAALRPLLVSFAREMDFMVEDVFEEQAVAGRDGTGAGSMLHIHNGDSAAATLRASGVPGEIGVWAEVLHEGPIPSGVSADGWRRTRARFYEACGWEPFEAALDRLRRWDETLESHARFGEVVLWFEHDLFDQLILIRHLDWFSRRDLGTTALSLICIGEYPGIARFIGLGQLTPDQIGSLLDTRQRITPVQFDLGRAAWQAFTAPDPTAIEAVLDGDTSALPFLEGALLRFLEQFPSVRNGLNRTENRALEAAAAGHATPADIFVAVSATEERPFLGDTSFLLDLERLAEGPRPLLTIEPGGDGSRSFSSGRVSVTEWGRQALEGGLDRVRTAGIDRWLGGVHLHGMEAGWRWDEEGRRLVVSRAAPR
jgi:RNA polymerase sigma factor (sigma-70 family)